MRRCNLSNNTGSGSSAVMSQPKAAMRAAVLPMPAPTSSTRRTRRSASHCNIRCVAGAPPGCRSPMFKRARNWWYLSMSAAQRLHGCQSLPRGIRDADRRQQLCDGAAVSERSGFELEHEVAIAQGTPTVRNDEERTPAAQGIERRGHLGFALWIEGTRCLIEDEDRNV